MRNRPNITRQDIVGAVRYGAIGFVAVGTIVLPAIATATGFGQQTSGIDVCGGLHIAEVLPYKPNGSFHRAGACAADQLGLGAK